MRLYGPMLLATAVALSGLGLVAPAAAYDGRELPATLERGPGVPHDQVPSIGPLANVPRSLLEEAARFAVLHPGPARDWIVGQSSQSRAGTAARRAPWCPPPTGALMTDLMRAVDRGWREVVTLRLRAAFDSAGNDRTAARLEREARALCLDLDKVTNGGASRALLALAPGGIQTAAR